MCRAWWIVFLLLMLKTWERMVTYCLQETECFLLSVMVIEHKHTLHLPDSER